MLVYLSQISAYESHCFPSPNLLDHLLNLEFTLYCVYATLRREPALLDTQFHTVMAVEVINSCNGFISS